MSKHTIKKEFIGAVYFFAFFLLMQTGARELPVIYFPKEMDVPSPAVEEISRVPLPENYCEESEELLPVVFAPTQYQGKIPLDPIYPWKKEIVATIFWVGENPSKNNPVCNTRSSWDIQWMKNYGGYDDPNARNRQGYRPKAFLPKQNPFYVALPYNDIYVRGTKKEARKVIPWFKEMYRGEGKTVLKGRWVAIRKGDRVCYAQWEDCGPFFTDDWRYVFGDARPKCRRNGGIGIDVSPAVRDYLGLKSGEKCDWRFAEIEEVKSGPWRHYGDNNPFVSRREKEFLVSITDSE